MILAVDCIVCKFLYRRQQGQSAFVMVEKIGVQIDGRQHSNH